MNETPLHQDEFCSVSFIDDLKCISVIWKKQAKNEELQNESNKILKLVEENKPEYYMADASNIDHNLSEKDENFVKGFFIPKLVSFKIKKFAGIIKPEKYKKIDKDDKTEIKTDGFIMKYFDNYKSAVKWLQER